ncbi:hypothetical protein RYX36_006787 [Vicia faba]
MMSFMRESHAETQRSYQQIIAAQIKQATHTQNHYTMLEKYVRHHKHSARQPERHFRPYPPPERTTRCINNTPRVAQGAKHVEFDNTRFIGPLQQGYFDDLVQRQIWTEKIFTLNPQGDYGEFMEKTDKQKWDPLLNPPTELNFDLVDEFYANMLPIDDVRYTFCTFVQGRAISLTRDAINQYLGTLSLFKEGNNLLTKRGLQVKVEVESGGGGVEIPAVSTKVIKSIVNEDYVLRHCMPKLGGEGASQPQEHAPLTDPGRFNEQ